MEIRQIFIGDIKTDMLRRFNRYQAVEKRWRKINGEWALIDNPHVTDWDEARKHTVA